MKIYNIKDKMEYLEEIAILTQKEWGEYSNEEEFKYKVNKKLKTI